MKPNISSKEQDDDEDIVEVDYVPFRVRKQREKELISQLSKFKKVKNTTNKEIVLQEDDDNNEQVYIDEKNNKESKNQIDINQEILRNRGGIGLTEAEKAEEEEKLQQKHVKLARQPLGSRKETINGIKYKNYNRISTGWKPPKKVLELKLHDIERIRKYYNIVVDGDDVPSPLQKFSSMRFPDIILEYLNNNGIKKPTPIQMQGFPIVLSGRDMIGIASTGSGKTLVFLLPIIMFAQREELKKPMNKNDGPIGQIVVPQRELASQIIDNLRTILSNIYKYQDNKSISSIKYHWPIQNAQLCIGGVNMRDEWNHIPYNSPIHFIVGTPGRITDMLEKKKIHLNDCIYFAMDEADRLVDENFEDSMRTIFDHFIKPRQTVLFSATMPPKVQEFASTALTDPIVVAVGRVGMTNINVIQEIEYVIHEEKLHRLLNALQKTSPPVMIFVNSQSTADKITEYLMLRGVDSEALHGGIEQKDRLDATRKFRNGQLDVLVATDVGSKGLDFPNVQHIINYDVPKEIEDYIHRIGRTGRCGKTGIATSFINYDSKEEFLLDLKNILKQAKQNIPKFLLDLHDPKDLIEAGYEDKACELCGGFGHRAQRCPKLAKQNASKIRNNYGFDVDNSTY